MLSKLKKTLMPTLHWLEKFTNVLLVGLSKMVRLPCCYSARSKKKQSQFIAFSHRFQSTDLCCCSLILAEVMQTAGIRAFVGKLSMDISSRKSYVEASAQKAMISCESFVEKCFALGAHLPVHKRLVEPVITPRFVPTCSDALLAGLGALAESKSLRVQSHLAESHDQVEWVKRERGIDDIQVFQNVSPNQ